MKPTRLQRKQWRQWRQACNLRSKRKLCQQWSEAMEYLAMFILLRDAVICEMGKLVMRDSYFDHEENPAPWYPDLALRHPAEPQ